MKRKTKAQREDEARAALRHRVSDIAVGAAGYNFDTEDEWAGAQMLSRFLPALKAQFGEEEEDEKGRKSNNHFLFESHNLEHYDNIDSATDFLFKNGIRA